MRLDANDYSVHPAVIGRRVEILADLARVRVLCDGKLVADHDRLWAKHQTVSDPEQVAAAKLLHRERVGLLRPVPRAGRADPLPRRLRHALGLDQSHNEGLDHGGVDGDDGEAVS